jgi:hypothetical protein
MEALPIYSEPPSPSLFRQDTYSMSTRLINFDCSSEDGAVSAKCERQNTQNADSFLVGV